MTLLAYPEQLACCLHLIQQPCGCQGTLPTADQHAFHWANSALPALKSSEFEEWSGKGMRFTRLDLFPRPSFYLWLWG